MRRRLVQIGASDAEKKRLYVVSVEGEVCVVYLSRKQSLTWKARVGGGEGEIAVKSVVCLFFARALF